MDSKKILALLAARFAPPEWTMFYEVRTHMGMNSGGLRIIDALAIDTYPSRGHKIIAFEVKCFRKDFLREMEDPTKRQFFVNYSNEFYFVAPKNVIRKDEVPEDCGLFTVYDTNTLKKVKQAPYHSLEKVPIYYMVSLLRQKYIFKELLEWKLFKYAGRDLSVEEFEDLVNRKVEERFQKNFQSLKWRISKEIEDKYRQREERIIDALRYIFGEHFYSISYLEKYKDKFRENYQMNVDEKVKKKIKDFLLHLLSEVDEHVG